MLVWNMALSLLTSAKLPIVFSRSAKKEKFVDQVKTLWKEYNVKLSWGFQLNCHLTITTNTFYSILLRLKVVKTLRTMIMLNKNKMKGFECVLWFVTNSQIMTYFTISYNRLSIGRKIINVHFNVHILKFDQFCLLTLISMGSSIPSVVWGGADSAPPSISSSRPCRNLKFGGYS